MILERTKLLICSIIYNFYITYRYYRFIFNFIIKNNDVYIEIQSSTHLLIKFIFDAKFQFIIQSQLNLNKFKLYKKLNLNFYIIFNYYWFIFISVYENYIYLCNH